MFNLIFLILGDLLIFILVLRVTRDIYCLRKEVKRLKERNCLFDNEGIW